jgi:hypothetical protein
MVPDAMSGSGRLGIERASAESDITKRESNPRTRVEKPLSMGQLTDIVYVK